MADAVLSVYACALPGTFVLLKMLSSHLCFRAESEAIINNMIQKEKKEKLRAEPLIHPNSAEDFNDGVYAEYEHVFK